MKNITILWIVLLTSIFSANSISAQISACQQTECVNYFKKFKVSAKRGHPIAMATLGQFYYYGYGTDKNDSLALKYFIRSAKLGNTAAQYKAGLLLLSNEQHKDIDKGLIYLKKAAKSKYKNATFILGIAYLSKEFGIHNKELADQYLAKAYQQKHQSMPSVIDHINESMSIEQASYPRLFQSMNDSPLIVNQNKVSEWPQSDIETITITSPPIETILNDQLVSFRAPRTTTGSRLKGKTCGEVVACLNIDAVSGIFELPWLRIIGS